VVSAYATVRKQFGMSVGKFEGIEEPLARIGGMTYLMDAARMYTCGALDQGTKPPVVTAVMKHATTEMARKIINDAMDIQGGAGISQGPRNMLAHGYMAAPISITVEGANILTRTLMIFGQGALRAHPYAYKEVEATETNNLTAFDQAFWAHMGHIVRNKFRAVLLTLTRGRLSPSPVSGPTARYYKKLAWISAVFALMADISMGALGGKLKVKGKLTGRFADILSWMYLASATLRRYEAEGRRREDLPFVHWSLQYSFQQMQIALDGLFANFDAPVLGWLMAHPIRWIFAVNPLGTAPSDALGAKISHLVQQPGEQRDRITAGVFMPKDSSYNAGRLEEAFRLTLESEDVFQKVRKAVKKGKLKKKPAAELYQDAVREGVITQSEFEVIARAERARGDVIQVDDFGLKEYLEGSRSSGKPASAPPVASA
jgi:acyl-CoA dehydrogenase